MQKYDEIDSFEFGQENPPEMFRNMIKVPRYHDVSKTPLKTIVAPYRAIWQMAPDELSLAEETN